MTRAPRKTGHGLTHCVRCGSPKEKPQGGAFFCLPCLTAQQRDSMKANNAIRRAVRSGEMRPAREHACVDCGEQAFCYDHRDYSRPLDVEPVCHACNIRRGPALPARTFA